MGDMHCGPCIQYPVKIPDKLAREHQAWYRDLWDLIDCYGESVR